MSAVRLARGVTGRVKIVKMSGRYREHRRRLAGAGSWTSAATTLGTPSSSRRDRRGRQDTILCPFNDARAVAEVLALSPARSPAVLLSRSPATWGSCLPELLLESLRELTAKQGHSPVFDKSRRRRRVRILRRIPRRCMRSHPTLQRRGRCWRRNCQQQHIAHRRVRALDLWRLLAGPIFPGAGTLGDPLAMATGSAARLLRDEPPYERLEPLSTRLVEGLVPLATDAEVPHVSKRIGSTLTLSSSTTAPLQRLRQRLLLRLAALLLLLRKILDSGHLLTCSSVRDRVRL